MKEKYPDNFRLDFAVSREQTNAKGEKMYIQTRMAEYAEELWELLKKDNTYVYMCGLKGMEKGIDDIMISLAAKDGNQIMSSFFLYMSTFYSHSVSIATYICHLHFYPLNFLLINLKQKDTNYTIFSHVLLFFLFRYRLVRLQEAVEESRAMECGSLLILAY